jgi:Uma2 family endonuclease
MTAPHSVRPSVIPPLQNGDQLTRQEFERRFDATPGLKKAELIEGRVYVSPPVSLEYHGEPHSNVICWLGNYRAATPGVRGGDNGSIRLDLDNMPQPDAFLLLDPAKGGQAHLDADGYVVGAPELVAEIAASTASYDLHAKLNVYRRSGVREYIVWRTYDRELDYFILNEGRYDRLAPGGDGICRSRAFPGLWLAPAALLNGELSEVLRVLQSGLTTLEHAAFVAQLAAKTGPSPR